MLDSGNSFQDVYSQLPPNVTTRPSSHVISLADNTSRKIPSDFDVYVCLPGISAPLHRTSSSLLPSHGPVPDGGPIFSLPRWVELGWHAHLYQDRSYIQYKQLPTKIYLSRTARGLWQLNFRWRSPGEMVLVSVDSSAFPDVSTCHLAESSQATPALLSDPTPALQPPTEADTIRSLGWRAISQTHSADAPFSHASVACIQHLRAQLDSPDGASFDLLPTPDPECPAFHALIHDDVSPSLCAAVSLSHPGVKIASRAEWYRRHGHLGRKYFQWWLQRHRHAADPKITAAECSCELCHYVRSHTTLICSKTQWVYIIKPYPTASCWVFDLTRRHHRDRSGSELALVGCDRATGFYVVYGLETKPKIFEAFKKHNALMRSLGFTWRHIVFDCESVLHTYSTRDQLTREMTEFTNYMGVHVQFTAPHQHWLNFMERNFRQLNLLANRNLIQAHVSDLLWLDALIHASDTLNAFPVFQGDRHMQLKA